MRLRRGSVGHAQPVRRRGRSRQRGRLGQRGYNDLVAQIGKLSPGDPAVDPLFHQALEIWLKELPVIPMAQRPEAAS